MTTDEWRYMDNIARSTIGLNLTKNVYFSMSKEKPTFTLWKKLHVVYEKKSTSSKLILIRQLLNIKIR